MQNYKIFIINLKRDSKRRELTIKEMEANNLSYEFIDAVDGNTLTNQDIGNLCDLEKCYSIYNRELSINELACSLSHQEVYKKIIADNLDGSFIFEDDNLLDSNIKKVLDTIYAKRDNLPINVWLGLGTSYFYRNKKIMQLTRTISLYKSWRTACAWAYYVDKEAARTLIKLNSPVVYTADHVKGYKDQLNLCCLNHDMVIPAYDATGSSIGLGTRAKKKLYKRVARVIRDFIGKIIGTSIKKYLLGHEKSKVSKELKNRGN